MGFKSKINVLRRAITHGLTKNIGSNQKPFNPSHPVKRVLVSRPNHRLGNLLLITPLVQEIERLYPDAKVDLFIKGGLGPIVFKNYTSIGQVLALPKKHFKQLGKYLGSWVGLKKHRYDLVINVATSSSSGKLSTGIARGKYKVFGELPAEITAQHPDYLHLGKYPVYNLRHFLNIDANVPMPELNLKLDDNELVKGKSDLQELVKNDKPTICIFTFATGGKCYPPEWWNPVYEQLMAEFSGYNIVEVLPAENVSQIGFAAPTYYSRDVREIGALMACTSVFIGADSGIMHLAAASGVPTVGLFNPTDPNRFGPYGGKNIAVDTNKTDTNGLIKVVKNILQQ
ncbi:ADP-heptose--LPS heptosyltransferase [Flavobacterium akiainvivens]|uniref:ADP-heptose--LPS heptosyltransferase n=1 Tax=Flavobacterium akiainvivens TaxID=1202724 RepID=A0A0M8MCF6_9FLAO|nr:glycosyltransferase family 9 protein [Flavobacterium akiainvivens]KOS07255.1 ADP-heptose--LPS heptosyltransferase [Flavobacterium akiainvivens]SFQ45747.1 ADP-heptose:LPS heptosyltransferase [Flavobacterium akiainvivens]